MTIGERIRAARKEKGWTQKQLEKKSGINEVQIRRYELNNSKPTIETLQKIADAFEIPVVRLLTIQKELEETELFLEREHRRESSYLLECFSKLNRTGKNKALDYIEDLLEQPKYQEDANSSAQNGDSLILGYPTNNQNEE